MTVVGSCEGLAVHRVHPWIPFSSDVDLGAGVGAFLGSFIHSNGKGIDGLKQATAELMWQQPLRQTRRG